MCRAGRQWEGRRVPGGRHQPTPGPSARLRRHTVSTGSTTAAGPVRGARALTTRREERERAAYGITQPRTELLGIEMQTDAGPGGNEGTPAPRGTTGSSGWRAGASWLCSDELPAVKGYHALRYLDNFSIKPLFSERICFTYKTQQLCFHTDVLLLMSFVCTPASTLIDDDFLWIVNKSPSPWHALRWLQF